MKIPVNKQIAWRTTEVLLVSLGGIGGFAYLCALPPLLIGAGSVAVSGTWAVLYKLQKSWQERAQ